MFRFLRVIEGKKPAGKLHAPLCDGRVLTYEWFYPPESVAAQGFQETETFFGQYFP
jgi:hypothetical protein